MATGQNIIDDALTEIGELAAGESPTAAETTYCLRILNRMLDNWATRKGYVYVVNHNSYTFTTSQQSYTIGPTATTPDFIATSRPVRIERANVVLVSGTPDVHVPLEVINTDDYAALGVPALSSEIPIKVYYQPTVSKGTLWPWPYPTNTSNQLELFTWHQLAAIASADLASTYALPPGYEQAIVLSLAEELAGPFGNPISAELERRARKARADIQSLNSVAPKMSTRDWGIPVSGGKLDFDFITGGFE